MDWRVTYLNLMVTGREKIARVLRTVPKNQVEEVQEKGAFPFMTG